MGKKLTVIGALAALDVDKDDDWTKPGLPKLDAIEEMIGEPITRNALDRVMPEGFCRESAEGFEFGDIVVVKPDEPDAIELIEAFVAAVQADRFRRNGVLQTIARHWMVEQVAARVHQDRLDERMTARKEAAAKALAK